MIVSVNGVNLPSPTGYDFELNDLDTENSKRAANGIFNRERIRADVFKLSLEWTMLTASEAAQILSAVSPQSFSVNAKFLGQVKTANMYCSSKKFKGRVIENNEERYDMSLNMVEL